jgi:FkbM family methyltransferase
MINRKSIAFHMTRLAYYIKELGVAAGVARFGGDYFRNFAQARGTVVTVKSPHHGDMFIRSRSSDFDVYHQTFYTGEYDIARFSQHQSLQQRYDDILRRGKTPLIIDGGGNIGAVSVLLSAMFPHARIVLVEPDDQNCAMAQRNTERLGNVELRRSALWSSPKILRMSTGSDAGAGNAISVSAREDQAAAGSSDIAATTIDAIMAERSDSELLLLKIDIEGAETEAIAAGADWAKSAPVCIIEPHDWMIPGHASLSRLLAIPSFREGDIMVSGENLVFYPAA